MKHSIKVIWDALHAYREDCIPEGDLMYDQQWDEICTAMAHIEDEIPFFIGGLNHGKSFNRM